MRIAHYEQVGVIPPFMGCACQQAIDWVTPSAALVIATQKNLEAVFFCSIPESKCKGRVKMNLCPGQHGVLLTGTLFSKCGEPAIHQKLADLKK